MKKAKNLLKVYRILFNEFGPQRWWPGKTCFEVMAGAILTQNTNWGNAAQAVANLRKNGLLAPQKVAVSSLGKLEKLIRPAGFYRQKARTLKSVAGYFLERHKGSAAKARKAGAALLRRELLAIKGIGPETADSILLYAFGLPVFVVDAYTKRVFFRHRLEPSAGGYDDWRRYFMSALKPEARLFNEYHALIVKLAKEHCRAKPICDGCPLRNFSVKY